MVNVYTNRGNTVAIVTNGTAVLELGNIGPYAAMPVMAGKVILFEDFAGIAAFSICLDTTDVDKAVETVKLLEPIFGGINLEDIAGPACFEIEEPLKKKMHILINNFKSLNKSCHYNNRCSMLILTLIPIGNGGIFL
ncbi:NAD-dependent malic enzyme [Desulfosporosinus acididurans]|uniref:NAD-dependent malic enzyme n=1 Tax=Desulfosporosinus acididurans TaxID=476652 RepID=A0A0J1FP29_9FIRM|nr:NAD-dependent malic enzyme [Desulfosporosinus acididurans]